MTEINMLFDYPDAFESIRRDIRKPANILILRIRSNTWVSMMKVDEFCRMIKNKIILVVMIWKFKICSDINTILLRDANFMNIWRKVWDDHFDFKILCVYSESVIHEM